MVIHGLQKLTLLDFPGKVACTVFLGGCDFRCPFCHNGELLDAGAPAVMDEAELLTFLQKRARLLEGVCFTGGEPTLRPELSALIRRVKALGLAVKLDTNGNHPAVLRALLDDGLVDYVAMDVKNAPARYGETTGRPGIDLVPIRESIALLLEGRCAYEFRTTVVRELHDPDDFAALGELIAGAERCYLQCFTDRDTVLRPGLHAPSREMLDRCMSALRPYVKSVELRGV